MQKIRIALAGNPNTGKSTVFNELTGAHQRVGNWPGKTVERKIGHFQHGELEVEIVDLPGTYSLSSFSLEETIARDYIINEKPDVVINVVDSCNLERNLYLTLQILETQAKMILAINMEDQADLLGYTIDYQTLSERLHGIQIIPMVASKGHGIKQLKTAISNCSHSIQLAN